jgi:hypothetical protein
MIETNKAQLIGFLGSDPERKENRILVAVDHTGSFARSNGFCEQVWHSRSPSALWTSRCCFRIFRW